VTEIAEKNFRAGVLYALAAHAMWGLMPLYLRLNPPRISRRSPGSPHRLERCISGRRHHPPSALGRNRRLPAPADDARLAIAQHAPHRLQLVCISSTASPSGRIVHNSLGYFINPLLNVLLGVVFFMSAFARPNGLPWGCVQRACVSDGRPGRGAVDLVVRPRRLRATAFCEKWPPGGPPA